MIIPADSLTAEAAYKLLIGSIVPRPIAWVSSVSPQGTANIAPISFFTAVGRKPPMISLTLQPRSDGRVLKDTFNNIRDTGEFVVNMATIPNSDAVHRSAYEFAPHEDEFELLGLEKARCEIVSVPRIESAPIAYECLVDRIIPVGETDNVVWGRIVQFHIRDDLYLERGRIDTAALAPVGRLAAEYTFVENVFTTPLPAETLAALEGIRMRRLDELDSGFSPIDTALWSASGSTRPAGQ
ncbi:flavin reductase family protein [Arthrobacter sp. ISL-69]|uniref:flavin reductase family protein n=1 Tax=Arthrobacter sp. ISL-69 TaxID=2819113 RepID=UPI001BE66F7B|nr:flavin reductase family protein [Arthrobacter sp. ISL-69]